MAPNETCLSARSSPINSPIPRCSSAHSIALPSSRRSLANTHATSPRKPATNRVSASFSNRNSCTCVRTTSRQPKKYARRNRVVSFASCARSLPRSEIHQKFTAADELHAIPALPGGVEQRSAATIFKTIFAWERRSSSLLCCARCAVRCRPRAAVFAKRARRSRSQPLQKCRLPPTRCPHADSTVDAIRSPGQDW